ncbi:MAG TPA: glutamine synthetase III [Pseudobdellovibrionaceae bacterium]|nr:glutamine synthetase III [Pseudobdellovibrionaceae bacterium]
MGHKSISSGLRASALKEAIHTKEITVEKPGGTNAPISDFFGSMTFGLAQMRDKLPKDAYQNLLKTLDHGKKLPKETAEAIASAVKEWSVAKGVTHFSHWFQPMTGLTAEKHDAFISIQTNFHSELKVIEKFTGSQLIQGEPDASSFPSGGMRSTFEARGYTTWDPSSPLFIIEDDAGKTLCIPTVFFGYHGQALDCKTPLLRSVEALNTEACEFLKLIGDVDIKKVQATLGAEQEYFLIDKNFVSLRPDLIMTGRTLLGAPSTRGQQLEDHYFGSIPTRVKKYMQDAELELFKLGIPAKTRHNEVAPSQFEIAPIFEDVNIGSDHNTLTMEVLKRVALKHGFVCLMHEKPFAGINGSGKHNNWSLSNDKGENLLEPGSTPHQNLRFLAVLSVVLKAVHDHAAVLRASIASPGNDHRLGANEAPPAIISVFLGSMLEKILNEIEEGKSAQATEAQIIDLGVGKIPNISKDYTDRNRTSPFAFTGNKFEFRAVGSSAIVSVPMTILNTAAAAAFRSASAELKTLLKTKNSRDEAIMDLIRSFVKESKKVRFDGNGYSEEWKVEAQRRGLPVLNTTAEALEVFKDVKATAFLSAEKVLSTEEILSRYHISVERYIKTIDIEIDTLLELVQTYVLPAVEKQITALGTTHTYLNLSTLKTKHTERSSQLEKAYLAILNLQDELQMAVNKVRELHDEAEKMKKLAHEIQPLSFKLRESCDIAENLVADEFWPLPKYREMLFSNSLS